MNHAVAKLTACAAALALAFPAMAQESPASGGAQEPSQPAAGGSDGRLQEVIITASKRKESLQTVPMSVDAITGGTLQKMNVLNFQDVEKLSPGLVLNPADGRGQNLALRGVTFDPDSGANPSVQIYWNETPISASDAFRGMFDISRIEVLRGPQGTLRGQTSPAGSITMATERPDLDEVTGRLVQTLGSRSLRNTQAAVNVPVIPGKLALRVAGLASHTGNGVHNVTNGGVSSDRSEGGRFSVLYQPAKSVEVLLVHQELSSTNVNYPIAVGAPAPGQAAGPTLTVDDRASVVEGNYTFYNKSKLTSLNVTWELEGHKLSYVGGFQQSKETNDRDLDANNAIAGWQNRGTVASDTLQRTHELRFESTGAGFWNYMVGAYHSDNRGAAAFTQTLPYYFPAPYVKPLETTIEGSIAPGTYGKGSALFTDQRFAVTDVDQLELGLRYQKNKSYNQQFLRIFGQVIPSLPDDRTHLDSSAWTGSASFRHNFSKAVMGYVSYGTGYRPGGAVSFVTAPGLKPDLILYKPEKSRSIELGAKSTLFDRRLVLNASVFQQKLKDYIARANILDVRAGAVPGEPAGPLAGGAYPSDPATTVNLNTNGDVISRGLEATAIWSILPNWRAQLSASYVDTHYDGALLYCNDGNNDGVPDQALNGVQPGRQVSLCRSDRRLADSTRIEPGKFSMVVQSEYSHGIGAVDGFVRGLVRYVPPGYNQPVDQRIASFIPVDLYVGVRDRSQQWEVSLWSQNLLDRSTSAIPPTGGALGGSVSGYHNVGLPQERKIGMTVRYDF
ncbi:MAG TPA: TonB-dependent receptor [Duganella sp.]|uniref:TonB-dependent receptor n=1 Tax=Duganella sp. TaxID=1904440 RepID=UPI002ED5ADD4